MSQKSIMTLFAAENQASADSGPAENIIELEVYDSFDLLESMQPQWDRFIESVDCEIFLTFDWCRIWWEYYGANRDLKVFVFRCRENLVGIIPMFFERIWLAPVFVRAGKIVGTDFTISTVTLPIRKEFLRQVVQKFLFKLVTDYQWDVLHIGPVSGIFRDFDELFSSCRDCIDRGCRLRNSCNSVQTYFPLTDSWEAQLAHLSKNGRKNIIRNYNALNRTLRNDQGNLVSRFATSEDFDEMFTDFIRMHQLHWQRLGKGGHFEDWPAAVEFHREVAAAQLRRGRLRLMQSSMGGYCLGYEYAYKFAGKYFAFLNSHLESQELGNVALGHILFSEQVKKALAERVRYIDSMRGKYEHKLRLGGKLFTIRNIYVYRGKISVLIRIYIFRFFCQLLDICYYKIWFRRLAPLLPFKHRPLWKSWIRTQMFS